MSSDQSNKYRSPPITEAVIEIRTTTPMDEKTEEKVVTKLRTKYPKRSDQDELNVSILPTGGGQIVVDKKHKACRLSNPDENEVLLVARSSIAYSRLAPYPGWDEFREQAKGVWNTWKNARQNNAIERIGLRFINRIDVPTQGRTEFRIEEFLNIYPQTPRMFNNPLDSYMIQVKLAVQDQWITTITSTPVPSPLLGHGSFLLDVDVYRTDDIPVKEDELWMLIESARTIKNSVFDGCVTEQTKELFK